MEENTSLSFLYFLYKMSYHYEKGFVPVNEAISTYILSQNLHDILFQNGEVERLIKKCMNLMITYRNSGYLSMKNSKNLPFTEMRIESENEEMMEWIEKFEESEEYVENISKSIQKKNSINRQYIYDVFKQFHQMSLDMEKEEKEEETELQEAMEDDNQAEEDEIIQIKSSDGSTTYQVNVSRWTCSCPSFQYSRYEEPTCKHVWKVFEERKKTALCEI